MSRNVRRKYPSTPTKGKPVKRRDSDSSSSLDLSDLSDGYSGVDEVSDSEDDDEEGVVAAEEEHIITRVSRKDRNPGSSRPVQDEDSDADEEDEDDDDDDNDDDLEPDDEDGDQSASWDGIPSEAEGSTASELGGDDAFMLAEDLPAARRQVRFTGVPDSDSDSTTSEMSDDMTEYFPDIFVEQTSLDPAFRREIEQDLDDVSSNSSFWDFHDTYDRNAEQSDPIDFFQGFEDETPLATPHGSHPPTEASTPVPSTEEAQDLDGYETDGDTTEEDIPEPLPRRRQIRRCETVEASSDSETDTTVKGRSRGRPRTGRFDLDSSVQKPIAVVNPITRKMIIFTPKKDGENRFDLSPESLRTFFSVPSADTAQSSPILSHSGSLMMGAMFSSNTFGDFMHSQPFGPVEAFFPTMSSDAFVGDDSDFSGIYDEEDAEDEEEKRLKLEDFITFQEHSDDEEAATPDDLGIDWEEGTNPDLPSTPGTRRPSTAMSANSDNILEVHPLLAHFDNNSDAVGAFRRNQVNQQLILSDRATSESLAFSGPYSLGTLRGIKHGSLETVTTPITPARRQKRTSMNGFNDFNRSPLANVSQKRKASGMHDGNHKKQRSISDVRDIAL